MAMETAGFDQYGPLSILEMVLDTLPIGVIFCDAELVIRYINKAYASYLKIEKSQAVGRKITEIIPDSRAEAVLRSATAELGETCTIRRRGEELTLIVNRLPVVGDDGEIVGFLSQTMFGDPAELKRLYQKVEHLDQQVQYYRRRYQSALSAMYSLDNILGQSAAIRRLKEYIGKYARSDSPVLILGATGTGKELVASAIHTESKRASGPFVSINCAAVPQELFESELFGYVAGSFTGAHKQGKIGHIELAHQGTLFLDEIGDMPLHAQVKLLRVIETKSILRLGATRPNHVDFRIVAATNRDPRTLIREGKFREDLFYRIGAMVLTIPTLAERKEDIPLLASHLLEQSGGTGVRLSGAAMDALMAYGWPGNIRELRNVMARAVSLAREGLVEAEDLPAEISGGLSAGGLRPAKGLAAVRDGSEQGLILTALREHHWNMVRTAKALGIGRATLYEKLKKYKITRE